MKSILFLVLTTVIFDVSADVYFEQPLSFGTIVIRDNSIQSSVIVPTFGHSTSSGQLLIIKPGEAAEMVITDYPPYVDLSITPMLPVITTVASGDTEQFTLSEIYIEQSIRTDSAGMAIAQMGGKLMTSGNGKHYLNTSYQAVFYLDISY
ncbi:DUF4402 domain-containing protein [Shewanella sp. 10N.261.52.F9]|uniref:DUF4402 domain-containing protein n=1 Tax=Shewanella TaxID=22 RepID=UPI00200E480E|nr:DUF4402 domain-containing protein [Shewanella marinintestina]MCL1145569.1 DUF4402 domain-containing protein [Shewanella marinintestina]